MKLQRYRFSVRRMIVMVVIAGVISAIAAAAGRVADRERYRQKAADAAAIAGRLRELIEATEPNQPMKRITHWTHIHGRPWPKTTAEAAELARYYENLIPKYEHAARYPWLPVEPDPPEPTR